MGVGDSREAAFTLRGPIPAGTWTIVGDGIIVEPVDVTFEIIWRSGASDTVLATFEHHFEPLTTGFAAVPYEANAEAPAADALAGDLLVLRFTGESATFAAAYSPNGDGANADGRIPFLVLP